MNEKDGRKRRKVVFADEIENANEQDSSENDDDDDNDDIYEEEDEAEEEANSFDSENESDIKNDKENNEKMEISDTECALPKKKSKLSTLIDEKDPTVLKWKENLAQKAADSFISRQSTIADLWKLVYGM